MIEGIYTGNMVAMNATKPLHYREDGLAGEPLSAGSGFMSMLKNAMGKVNYSQVESEKLARQMIHQPESVDIHSVMIAAQKAEISLTLAKTIRDEAIRSYRELMNLR